VDGKIFEEKLLILAIWTMFLQKMFPEWVVRFSRDVTTKNLEQTTSSAHIVFSKTMIWKKVAHINHLDKFSSNIFPEFKILEETTSSAHQTNYSQTGVCTAGGTAREISSLHALPLHCDYE
jgi:hypothetical protein